jgi:hypothetical protein
MPAENEVNRTHLIRLIDKLACRCGGCWSRADPIAMRYVLMMLRRALRFLAVLARYSSLWKDKSARTWWRARICDIFFMATTHRIYLIDIACDVLRDLFVLLLTFDDAI